MKSYTDLEQSKKLAEILPLESADMRYDEYTSHIDGTPKVGYKEGITEGIPCWSLAALLGLMPKHISRKDNIHCEQTFIPSFRWEITPTAIYYTDGNDIMDYVSFNYGYEKNNMELIDAVFKMIVWLKENEKL